MTLDFGRHTLVQVAGCVENMDMLLATVPKGQNPDTMREEETTDTMGKIEDRIIRSTIRAGICLEMKGLFLKVAMKKLNTILQMKDLAVISLAMVLVAV